MNVSNFSGHTIFSGHVWHRRTIKFEHSFSYPILMVGVDVKSLTTLVNQSHVFSEKKWGLFSFRDSDFLYRSGERAVHNNEELFIRLSHYVEENHGRSDADRIIVMTTPRVFGYAFNPVHFYLFFKNGVIEQILCEVRNTFGQTHRYLSQRCSDSNPKETSIFRFPKQFCVSPFFGRNGDYQVITKQDGNNFSITVDLFEDGCSVFSAGLTGQISQFSNSSFFWHFLKSPSIGWMTMTRISQHALILIKNKVSTFPLLSLINASDTHRPRSFIEQARLKVLSCLTGGKFREDR